MAQTMIEALSEEQSKFDKLQKSHADLDGKSQLNQVKTANDIIMKQSE
jgi:hypothetical protein